MVSIHFHVILFQTRLWPTSSWRMQVVEASLTAGLRACTDSVPVRERPASCKAGRHGPPLPYDALCRRKSEQEPGGAENRAVVIPFTLASGPQ